MILDSDTIRSVEAIAEGGYRVVLEPRAGDALGLVLTIPFDTTNPDLQRAHAHFTGTVFSTEQPDPADSDFPAKEQEA